MRSDFLVRPWWMLGLGSGALFGFGMAAFLVAREGWGLQPVLFGAAQGVVFGAVMGPLLARQQRRVFGEVARLPAGQRSVVLRAAKGGPLPTDEVALDAARSVVGRQYEQAQDQRVGSIILFGGLTVLALVLTVTSDWRWLFGCVLFAIFAVQSWVSTRRLGQRLQVLLAHRIQPQTDEQPGESESS